MMDAENLSARATVAKFQILALENEASGLSDEEIVVQSHAVLSALSDEERAEMPNFVRDCAFRAQKCAVQVLKGMNLLALALAIDGSNMTNASAVALYQQHVDRTDLSEWIRAIIRTKLVAAQAAIEAVQKPKPAPVQKKPKSAPKPVAIETVPAKKDPVVVQQSVVAVAPEVVEPPKPKSLREKLNEFLASLRKGFWVYRAVYETLSEASDSKKNKLADLIEKIEAEKQPCFEKVRASVAVALKKAGYVSASLALTEDANDEATEALGLALRAHIEGLPGWMCGPIQYRLEQLRHIGRRRKLVEVDSIAGKLAKLVGGIQAATEQAEQIPDLAEALLGEAEVMFVDAEELYCEFWALEELIVTGDVATFVGLKLQNDQEFAKKVLVKSAKQKAQEFRKLLLDQGFEALEKLRKLVAEKKTTVASRHDGKHSRVRSKHPNLLANHVDSLRKPRREMVTSRS